MRLISARHPAVPVLLAISGAATTLAFPEPDLFPLAWVGVAPLIAAARDVRARRGFALGLMWGLGFFGALLYWITIIGFLGWIVLVLLQSSFVALFGAAWAHLARRARTSVALVALPAVLWVTVAEVLRANLPVVGFTWGQLAQSQTDFAPMMRVASIGGSWTVAGIVVAVNALVLLALRSGFGGRPGAALPAIVAAAAVLLAPVAIPAPTGDGERLRVAIVQGNIPRAMEPSYEKDLVILENHRGLTEGLRGTDLVVWPESSLGIDPRRVTEVALQIADASRAAGSPLLIGGDLERDDGRRQVMAYLFSADGEIVDQYQKTHLVPFGEYVPARWLFGRIPDVRQVGRDAVPGTEPALFDISGVPLAPVISFEGDFGSLVRERIARGGRILVIATNTSTWGDSWASAQHLAMARLRAAENGVPVVHAALTGISAFISASGEVEERTSLWTPAVLERDVVASRDITLYASWGDWVAWICLLVTGTLLLTGGRARPRDSV